MSRKKNSKEKVVKEINKDVSRARKTKNKSYKRVLEDIGNVQSTFEPSKKFLDKSKITSKNLLVGKFIGNERGFGFVEIEDREEDIFIPASSVKNAMNGDIVAIRISNDKSEGRRAEGTVVDVLQRNVKTVVGVYTKSKNFGFVVADDKKLSADIYIPKNARGKAKTNDKVVVEITRYPEKDKKAEGRIVEILGKADDTNVDLLSILRVYGYKKEFPKDVQKEANMMPQVVLNIDGRVDLRDFYDRWCRYKGYR